MILKLKHGLRLTAILLFFNLSAQAQPVIPLVVSSEFHNDSWFPLPVEQMKAAAVDTALMEISRLQRFAYIYETADSKARNGSIFLKVELVEPAEIARLNIKLHLPNNQGSFESAASVSLDNKGFDGIYTALESLGRKASESIVLDVRRKYSEQADAGQRSQDQRRVLDELDRMNTNMIMLGDYVKFANQQRAISTMSELDRQEHNRQVLSELKKLDLILAKLNATHQVAVETLKTGQQTQAIAREARDLSRQTYDAVKKSQDYAVRSDAQQLRKLNAIYDGILKLSSESAASLPDANTLNKQDVAALEWYEKSLESKYASQFDQARQMLDRAFAIPGQSDRVFEVIRNERDYGLPYFEASILSMHLGRDFQNLNNEHEHKKQIEYIRGLYQDILANNQLSFKQRIEVKNKMDQLLITNEAMDVTIAHMHKNAMHSFKMLLHNWYSKAMVFGKQDCPNETDVAQIIQQSGAPYTLQSISRGECKLNMIDNYNNPVVATISDGYIEVYR